MVYPQPKVLLPSTPVEEQTPGPVYIGTVTAIVLEAVVILVGYGAWSLIRMAWEAWS